MENEKHFKERFPDDLTGNSQYQKGVDEGRLNLVSTLKLFDESVEENKKIYLFRSKNLHPEGEITKIDPALKNHYEKLGMEEQEIRRLIMTAIELGQNGTRYGDKSYPVTIDIYETLENGTPYIYIEVIDKINEGKTEDEKAKERGNINRLKKYIETANNSTKKQIKDIYREELASGNINEKGGAMLGFREIGKKIKINDEDKPLKYEDAKVEIEDEQGNKIKLIKITCKINASNTNISDKIGRISSEDIEKEKIK